MIPGQVPIVDNCARQIQTGTRVLRLRCGGKTS
jgi:hypothetical protein